MSIIITKGVSDSLAGRVCIFHLYGLSTNEISGVKDIPFLPTHERISEVAYKKYRKLCWMIYSMFCDIIV